jgi:hypothetical protein
LDHASIIKLVFKCMLEGPLQNIICWLKDIYTFG